jgi:hypothetical protein
MPHRAAMQVEKISAKHHAALDSDNAEIYCHAWTTSYCELVLRRKLQGQPLLIIATRKC